jgi:5-enolpyruvylshikimate-3-phosphate synthase
MVTFTKNWELALFLEKVDQLGTQIFLPLRIEQKFKDCTIQQSAACKGKQNTSCLLMALQALGGTTLYTIPSPWISSSL